MRQRIKIAQGIVHAPEVIILDEPLNGLDPVARRDITTLLHRLATEGKCIVVSSHILYEVEQMTASILLLSKGRVQAQGDVYQIRGLIDKHPHKIAIESPQAREIARVLLSLPHVLSVKLDATNPAIVEIETTAPETFYSQFSEMMLENDFQILSFDSPDNNLESVFRYLTQ